MTHTATATAPASVEGAYDPAERYYCTKCGAGVYQPCKSPSREKYESIHEARTLLMQRCLMSPRVQAAMYVIDWADRPDLAGLPA